MWSLHWFCGGDVPVTRETPGQVYERATLTGIEYYWERVVRTFRRHS